jgi:hypothetical protein
MTGIASARTGFVIRIMEKIIAAMIARISTRMLARVS